MKFLILGIKCVLINLGFEGTEYFGGYSNTIIFCSEFLNCIFFFLKGGDAKMRPPETLKCSKSKTCKARKLKLHQPVYLIR